MRNPSSAKSIAPKAGIKLVENYENRAGKYVQVYECASSDDVDSLREAAKIGKSECKVRGLVVSIISDPL